MFIVEVYLPAGREAEQFNTAVYRFIELHLPCIGDDHTVVLESFPQGSVERKRVTLWSAAAARKFRRFWRNFIADQDRGPRFRASVAEARA